MPLPGWRGALSALLSGALALLCAACVTPIPMTQKTQTPSGVSAQLEFAFLEAGKTTHDEVRQRLAAIDAGCPQKRFFWGRWVSSSSGVAWFVGGASPGVGPAGAAGANRHWSAKNLLAEFDAQGVLRSYRIVGDSDLPRELRAAAATKAERATDTETLSLSHYHHRGQTYSPAELLLTADFLEMREALQPDHELRVPRAELADVRPADPHIRGQQPDAAFLLATLHFRSKTPAGRKVTVRIEPQALLRLLAYLDAVPKAP